MRLVRLTRHRLSIAIACVSGLLASGCVSSRSSRPTAEFPPSPSYPPDHHYTLDELIELSVYRNASLDVARYEALAAQGLVDQVKALWLPALRYTFAAVTYDNDLSYKANVFDVASLNVPITGSYNLINALSLSQIIGTGGKRRSGLKQARMLAAIKRLDVLRQQDQVALDVAMFYQLVCLTNDIDVVLEDGLRRLRVFRNVAEELNQRGSLRSSNLDFLQADYFVAQIEQLRVAVRAGRHQAYQALKHYVGVGMDEPLLLRRVSLPPPLRPHEVISVYASIVRGFLNRSETKQVNLFSKIREEQVQFAKAAWAPTIALLGTYASTRGNSRTILEVIDGLIASIVVDVPIYDPARRGRLREALGLEYASKAFQRQIEQLITLEIEVSAVEAQKALAIVLKAERARRAAKEHYDSARQAYSRELVSASAVVMGIALDMAAKIQYDQALFAYHKARATLRRVTADRETRYGY